MPGFWADAAKISGPEAKSQAVQGSSSSLLRQLLGDVEVCAGSVMQTKEIKAGYGTGRAAVGEVVDLVPPQVPVRHEPAPLASTLPACLARRRRLGHARGPCP